MRILAYTNLYPPECRAGAQTMLRDLLRPLRPDHEIQIVVHDGRGRTEPYRWEGIDVHPDPERAVGRPEVRGADLIITHLQATESAGKLGDQWGVPVVQILHDEDLEAHEYLHHRCDFAVFNTHWVADAFAEYTGRGAVIYPPIRPQEYRAVAGRAVTLVNIADIKGSEVFYRLAEAFPDVPFLGVIGGYGRQDIRQRPNVTIMESVDDMRRVFGRTRIVLMPSVYESYGRSAIEAAASGIPTIAAPTPGLRESLGDAGIFCPTDDVSAWERELERLLEPTEWRTASRRSAARSAELAAITERQLVEWRALVESFAPVATYR